MIKMAEKCMAVVNVSSGKCNHPVKFSNPITNPAYKDVCGVHYKSLKSRKDMLIGNLSLLPLYLRIRKSEDNPFDNQEIKTLLLDEIKVRDSILKLEISESLFFKHLSRKYHSNKKKLFTNKNIIYKILKFLDPEEICCSLSQVSKNFTDVTRFFFIPNLKYIFWNSPTNFTQFSKLGKTLRDIEIYFDFDMDLSNMNLLIDKIKNVEEYNFKGAIFFLEKLRNINKINYFETKFFLETVLDAPAPMRTKDFLGCFSPFKFALMIHLFGKDLIKQLFIQNKVDASFDDLRENSAQTKTITYRNQVLAEYFMDNLKTLPDGLYCLKTSDDRHDCNLLWEIIHTKFLNQMKDLVKMLDS